MTRLTLHSKPYELTLLQPGEPGQVKEVPKLHARSSSSDARRGERSLRVRKNSDSEVSYFAPDVAEKSNIKESNLRSSIDATVMAHMLIHESKHLTRSALEKSPNQWRKPARSVVFDDFPHDNMETEVNEANDEMEENWTPVLRKKKKKLRDRKVSMNSDEGVGDLSWSSGAMLGDARSPGVIGDSRSPSKVMVGDINLVSNLSPEIPLTLFKPKHPLGQAWTLWYRQPMPLALSPTVGWSSSHQLVGTIATVEDFWQLHQLIKPPSCLGLANDYAMFRQGVNPDWDDPANCGGGRWVVRRERGQELDSAWLSLLYLLLGEHLGEQAQVMGVVASRRKKGDRVSVWVGDARRLGAVVDVGRMVRDRLDMKPDARLLFSVHREQKEAEEEGAELLPPLLL